MKPEAIILSKISQTEKDKYCLKANYINILTYSKI